jgi:hypothetical protein
MIIDIPKVGEVEFPDSMSEQEVNAAAKRLYDQANAPVAETGGMARTGELLLRGAAPVAAGAGIGALAGGAPGALIGSMAVPIADAATLIGNELNKGNVAVENYVRNLLGMQARQVTPTQMPSQALSQGMAQMGLPEPTSTGERVIEAIGSGVGGTATQLPALGRLATTATTEGGRRLAGQLAQAPGTQLAVSVPSAAAAQYVGETTGSPALGMLAGVGVGAAGGIRPKQTEAIPTIDDLRAFSSAAYQRSADAGAVIKPESLSNVGQKIVEKVSNKIVIDPEVDTQATAVIRRLTKTFESPQSLEQLDLTRQFIRDASAGGGRDAKFAREALKEFDNYINTLGAKDLVAGNAKQAVSALNEARDLWKRSQKAQIFEDIMQSADIRSVTNYSQSGMENALRRKLVNLADSEDMKFFTKTEQQAIRSAAKGGNVQNFLRWAGRLSPSSIVAGAGGSYLGASLLGPAGAVIAPVAGGIAKIGATRIGLNKFQELQDMIALGRLPENQKRTRLMGVTGIRGLLSSPEERQQLIDEETNLGQ